MLTLTLPRPWPTEAAAAEAMQERLRHQVDLTSAGPQHLRTVAGLDVAYDTGSDRVVGAVTILDAATLTVLDQATAAGRAAFGYVPGLLAFRELPPLVEAWNRLTVSEPPDLLVCDGYGLAHPRRFGLACHLGALTGLPAIGVGKTTFIGTYEQPERARGAWSALVDAGEVVGRAVRTQPETTRTADQTCRQALRALPPAM